jgi:hypothetical protein
MPLLTNYFTVSWAPFHHATHAYLSNVKKQPKQQRSPSPDMYQLSDSEISAGDLDLSSVDEDHFTSILNLDLFDFCYDEIEDEAELIGEEEADALYGVSTIDLDKVQEVNRQIDRNLWK